MSQHQFFLSFSSVGSLHFQFPPDKASLSLFFSNHQYLYSTPNLETPTASPLSLYLLAIDSFYSDLIFSTYLISEFDFTRFSSYAAKLKFPRRPPHTRFSAPLCSPRPPPRPLPSTLLQLKSLILDLSSLHSSVSSIQSYFKKIQSKLS
ncbi:hypothetical protein ACH5RR_025666 [Cinchona calisaya]|uniref:Uncharacterized protein n=1 Tax=Cinchona calisaya TaxID=153742 RepID=A0ABD2Z2M5_9GENT